MVVREGRRRRNSKHSNRCAQPGGAGARRRSAEPAPGVGGWAHGDRRLRSVGEAAQVFYAANAVWNASNLSLAHSRYELYCDRANAITVTLPSGAQHTLDRVLARLRNPVGGAGVYNPNETGLGLDVAQDCIMVATAIIGQPPVGQDRELVIAGGSASSRSFGEYQTAMAMLAWRVLGT